jgi:sortase A
VKRALKITSAVLTVFAIALLAICAYVLIESRGYQNRQNQLLETRLLKPAAQPVPPEPASGLIGRIEIPRLDISVMVIEGSTDAILRHAAGHIAGTALPGRPGNVGISAHRDTFFRPLRNIRGGDIVVLTTPFGAWRYRVVSTRIVKPENVSVLDPTPTPVLTLVTCYPFYFLGPAPDRFIVRAEQL